MVAAAERTAAEVQRQLDAQKAIVEERDAVTELGLI